MASVKLHGAWSSPYTRRVKIALEVKGVEYEFIDEDLVNKSEVLLKYNPIHKKVPVLVHDGRVIVESMVILEYIDETWKDHPILPSDPYERSQARFWARFIDDKVMVTLRSAYFSKGGGSPNAAQELQEVLAILDNEIKGKQCYGGNSVGYVDIAGLFLTYWMPIFAEITGNEVITRDKFPNIRSWGDRVLEHPVVIDNLPERVELISSLKARFGPK